MKVTIGRSLMLLSLYNIHSRVKTCTVALSLSRRYASNIDYSFDAGESQAFASTYHAPVMYRECISSMLECERGRLRSAECSESIDQRMIFVDGTLGGGGHSMALLQSMQTQDILIGCDRDPIALKTASERLQEFIDKGMFIPHQSNFRDLSSTLKSVRDHGGHLPWSDNERVSVDG